VLGKVTGLNPFWVFISILTGARVGGLLGVIVAVPTAVVIKEALVAVRSARKVNDPVQSISMNDTSLEEPHLNSAEPVIEVKKLPQEEASTSL
jgi:hypothetical protein